MVGRSLHLRVGESHEFNDFINLMELINLPTLGSHCFVVKEKLRLLRDRLKWWNKEVFGWVDLRIEEADIELNDCDENMKIDALEVGGN
ncbi:unnamed protein product [Lathyrus oleraceus]